MPAKEKLNRRSAMGGAVALGLASSAKATTAAEPLLGGMLGRRKTGPSVYKSQAAQDYQSSLAGQGGCLATDPARLLHPVQRTTPWQFDVLVIGSGYGASISAARLANALGPAGRLGILERGREWLPGTFPDRLPDVLNESRLQLFGRDKTASDNPVGLFDVRQFEEITTLAGSGLGGSSLINASVAIRADQDVFQQSMWPRVLRDRAMLDPYYELAECELGVSREPVDHTCKMTAQRIAGERLSACGGHFEPAKLMVTRANVQGSLPVLNRQGMIQRGCIDCGDCLTGCNVGAKNMLSYNYLPLARRAGAEIFTQTEVNRIEKCAGFYKVHFTHYLLQKCGTVQKYFGQTTTRILILGAGSLGSTEILLRSASSQLTLSARLGQSWTGNGDALGFIRKSQLPTGIGGYSAFPTDRAPVGPTIQSNLTYPHRSLAGRVLIQDGAAARAYANALGALMLDPDLDSTQILLGMGHDGAGGSITLDDRGHARVSWPDLLEGPYRKLIRGEFNRVAQAMGGEYRFLKIFGDRMISVHPLGGCGMSEDPACGVLNHKGQVFDATAGGDLDYRTGEARVHDGLYVIDGAMLPTSIGCNPSLTIAALAERSADLIRAEERYADLFLR